MGEDGPKFVLERISQRFTPDSILSCTPCLSPKNIFRTYFRCETKVSNPQYESACYSSFHSFCPQVCVSLWDHEAAVSGKGRLIKTWGRTVKFTVYTHVIMPPPAPLPYTVYNMTICLPSVTAVQLSLSPLTYVFCWGSQFVFAS